ncbi:MAG TPA: erythromycin esterase family protein [Chloroflexota bacterium]
MITHLPASDQELVDQTKDVAHPLQEEDLRGYDPLLELVGNARIVMLGEASHGTHEFYRERARITARLIEELDFTFVAVEGDWPECYGVHRYVCGGPSSARDALSAFKAFPTWMWGNLDALHFVEWLRRQNESLPEGRRKVGFYGLDLYSLYASMRMVIEYLERVDPETARLARRRYACFEPFSAKDRYAYTVGLGLAESCEQEAVAMLQELQRKRDQYLQLSSDDQYFCAMLCAAVARDGERYYRSMYRSDVSSWNLRDTHMMSTLAALLEHFGPESRAVVWAHNTHVGDFRATADADGMVNIGQLVRERYPNQSIAMGFGTYEGSVTAATEWGQPPQRMQVPRARPGSYDNDFHQTELLRFLIALKRVREEGLPHALNEWKGQRAIGVVYRPDYEQGNYVPSRLADRYDAYVHIDRTRAVKPLNIEPMWIPPPLEETYPSGY